MKNKDFIIFLRSFGPNVRLNNLFETLTSIVYTTQNCDFSFYFSTNDKIAKDIESYFYLTKKPNLIEEISISSDSWASEFNKYFEKYKEKMNWVVYSHDDLRLETNDWFGILMNDLSNKKEKVAWISFYNPSYYLNDNEPRAVSARPGFCLDREKFPCVAECHKFHWHTHYKNSINNLNLLDMPKKELVKVHAPMTCFNIISKDIMKKIGYCEDWTPYSMLVDEDWGLKALELNYYNVIHYGIQYIHPLRNDSRPTQNKWEKEAHEGFVKKWGFDIPYSNDTVKMVKEKYKNTLIPWSCDKYSYSWEYLK